MSKLQTPRGTHDILGDDFLKHQFIYQTAQNLCEVYGFTGISTPIFEFTQVFARTLGDSSDIVTKEMYTFEDRGGESLTLRPEGTAGIARAIVSNGLTRQLPQKFFYFGPMFRYERPQKGRYRQFHQLGVELIGSDQEQSDIEVISLAYSFLNRIGLKNLNLEINSIGDVESRAIYRDKIVAYFSQFKDKLSEDSLKRLDTNPLRILDSKDTGDIELIKNAPKLSESLNAESAARFEKILKGIKDLEIPYTINEKLVRGLDYYSHCVFEFTSGELGAQNTVLAGGRYNDLIQMMGGPQTPSVGWACGIERLVLLLESAPKAKTPTHIIPLGEEAEALANKLLHELRNKDIFVETSYGGNLGKRMKKANAANAEKAIIIGSEEISKGIGVVRDLKTGAQTEVSLGKLAEFLVE